MMEHRVGGDIYIISYWRKSADNFVTAADLATADRACVEVMGHPYYPTFEFPITDGKHPDAMDRLLVALAHAYKRGQKNWAATVRDVLAGPK